jgi:hypothetical protein
MSLHPGRWIVGVLVVAAVLVAVLLSVGSGGSTQREGAQAAEPATVEPIEGTDLSRVKLSAAAAERLGIRTMVVEQRGSRTVIPYDAVLYAPDGSTFTYSSPEPRVFVRHPIRVDRIVGDRALLSSGPPVGTAVVTVGSQELFGTEFEVEED